MGAVREYTEADRPPVLDLLKVHGPSNVPTLARLKGVNANAVRQQLSALEREGLVEVRVEKRKVGRPTHLYALTPKAEALFPQAYGPLALSLLRLLRETEGEAKIRRLLERRSRELLARYRERLAGKSLGEKWQELARIRDEEGYMARVTGRGLTEHHCPIAAIAREFPEVCRLEKLLFEAALGSNLDRTEHLASGGRACVYVPAVPPRPKR
jgi:predicted ArsR family transcriptional regulator